jgi:hypothetical protein
VKIQTARGTSLAVSVHLGTSLRYVDQVPKCPKAVHLGLDHVPPLIFKELGGIAFPDGMNSDMEQLDLERQIKHFLLRNDHPEELK